MKHGASLYRNARLALLSVALAGALLVASGCNVVNSDFCCLSETTCDMNKGPGEITPCTDPSKPYCDDQGEYGPGRTCIPDPIGASCEGPDDCPATRPVCLAEVCVECETAAECAVTMPVCNETTHQCEACTANEDCEALAATPRCDDASGECVQCLGPEDCGGSTPVCDLNACRGCTADSECTSEVCEEDAGSCLDAAEVIYLSTTGVPGTCTQVSPCGSFAQGLLQVAGARNVIKAAAGTYTGQVAIDNLAVTIYGDGATVQPSASNQSVVTVANGADATIEGLTVTGASGAGNPVAVTCTSPTSTIRLRRSNIVANLGGGGLSINGCQFSVTNNFIGPNGNVTSAFGGVNVSQITTAGLHEFAFNTVTANGGAVNAITGLICSTTTTPMVFSNNIVFGNQVSGTGTQVGGDAGCTWTYSDIGPQTVSGTGNINMDPLFVDPGNRDYHLMPTSPAKNVADPAAATSRDIDGDLRPLGGRSDMGADEVVE